MLIVIPLIIAFFVERWASGRDERKAVIDRLGWFPVPLLSVVVFLIAGAQAEIVAKAWPILGDVLPAFVLFLLGAAALGLLLARFLALPTDQTRTLVFSLATRNSFVVLPFAMALPAEWSIAIVVIVFQSLVELFGMILFVWWVPNRLVPAR